MRRWPGWVYQEGTEPDPRFSLANERTYLAWIRTGLAFLAVGVAVAAVGGHQQPRPAVTELTALLMIITGTACGVVGYWRWMTHERALRRGDPLPNSTMMPLLALVMVVIAALGISLVI